ncbi:MAG: ATP-binding cassette domain-containing protein [Chloroflexi bacterium]|nr:ATP-binding cassette domain-containing protein [Chloroflexota bacterium]
MVRLQLPSAFRERRVALPAIFIENLIRVFKTTTGIVRRKQKEIVALDGVSLSVESGELFGLLGPNGAGKTTITKILATILLPTSGRAEVLGLDVVRDTAKLRPRIGIVFGGDRGLYWRLSGRDNIQYFADLYHVPPDVAKKRIPELLELVGLKDRADERVEGYSRGMKQRLHIARGLISDPEILFLDEPTIGLDPVAARELRQVIHGLKEAGKTVFLTSHYMFEIDALCDRVAVLSKGKILTVDTPSALKRLVADLEVVEIECLGAPSALIAKLREHPGVEAVNVEAREQTQVLQIQAPAGAELVQDFLRLLDGVRVQKVVTRQPTLEDAYVKLVGKEALNT